MDPLAPAVRFDPRGLVLLDIIIALMMFGVALTLVPEDFKRVLRRPLAPFAGLAAQFLILPALTCFATMLLGLGPEPALGLMLVAACPGGSFSNILTWRGRGNVALSVSMTAISSVAATLLMPANFAFYAWVNPVTRDYVRAIAIPPAGMLGLVLVVLGLPLAAGMLASRRFPSLASRAEGPLRIVSLVVLLLFVGVAFAQNLDVFVTRFNAFFWLTVGQSTLAFIVGYLVARVLRVADADRRAIVFEVGIQNTALGLVLLFTFFPQAGEMMLITAFRGVWHLLPGLALAAWWARRDPVPA